MATGIVKQNSIYSFKVETTEGTYIAPAAATDYLQVIEAEVVGNRETQEREIMTEGLAKAKPIPGTKSSESTVSVELRGAGTEGVATDHHPLLKATFGGYKDQSSARISTGVSHSTTQIFLSDTSDLEVNQPIVILESGAHSVNYIASMVANTSITLGVTLSGAPADAVELAKFQLYKFSDTQSDYETLTFSSYLANEIRRSASGLRPTSFAVTDWSTGALPKMEFSLEGTTFSEVDGSAPQTPSFDSGLPSLVLSACLYVDGTQVDVNSASLNVDSPVSFLTSTCNADGRIASRRIQRSLTLEIDPFKDDTSVSYFTAFDGNTSQDVFWFNAEPSSVSGEYNLGSITAFHAPSGTITSQGVSDLDGVLQDAVSYSLDGGSTGSTGELWMMIC